MSEDTASLIRKQVEYYFSDKNLETDQFFHGKISEAKDGYLDMQYIMNSNKIKQFTNNEQDIIDAIKDSTEVEHELGTHTFGIYTSMGLALS